MKRLLPLFLALLLVLPLTVGAAADFPLCRCSAGTEGAFYKGSGSEQNPFRIRTDREFYEEVMALRTDDIPDRPDKVLDPFFIDEGRTLPVNQ